MFRKIYAIFITLIVISVSVSYSPRLEAGAFTAFGPRVYLRHDGTPITEVDSFTTSYIDSRYTLRIHNGSLVDDVYELVSSSIIFLNGVEILSPQELNQNVDYIEKVVTLQAVNEIRVEVRGKPGGALIISIDGDDGIAPSITALVSPPPNSQGWHDGDAVVSFTCDDQESGVASCTAPITLSDEGAGQIITGTAVDIAGNTNSTSVTINLDKSLPVLSITSPADGTTVTESIVNIVGQITDAVSSATGSIDGLPIALDVNGNFIHPVTLNEGLNSIFIEAVDAAGNAADIDGGNTGATLDIYLLSNQAPIADSQSISIAKMCFQISPCLPVIAMVTF